MLYINSPPLSETRQYLMLGNLIHASRFGVVVALLYWGPHSEFNSQSVEQLSGAGKAFCNVGKKVETGERCGGGTGCDVIDLDQWYGADCGHVNTHKIGANVSCKDIPILNCTGDLSHDIVHDSCAPWVLFCSPF